MQSTLASTDHCAARGTGVVVLSLLAIQSASAQPAPKFPLAWATLTGQFVYQGEPPKPKQIVVNKEIDICGQTPVYDESLLVDPATRGIANVVIYVRSTPRVHPDLAKPAKEDVLLETKNCVFVPHVQVGQVGQQLVCENRDGGGHNFNSLWFFLKPTISPSISGANKQLYPIRRPAGPTSITCNVHPWEKAFVVAVDNPYIDVTDKQGRFTLRDLPAGESLELTIWHEIPGRLDLTFAESWLARSGKGRPAWNIRLEAGRDLSLGSIVVPSTLFVEQ